MDPNRANFVLCKQVNRGGLAILPTSLRMQNYLKSHDPKPVESFNCAHSILQRHADCAPSANLLHGRVNDSFFLCGRSKCLVVRQVCTYERARSGSMPFNRFLSILNIRTSLPNTQHFEDAVFPANYDHANFVDKGCANLDD